eukprot:gnl/TRDRNA2_/TRDRNA2_169273_c1_seq2.p1 gnl/TRDRNA2_/TRDRNA2_169273_c1~~gnl/TRDRNA2_/TRDRNA2_169273_c1_seq2.p1  ORF type:complete len:710 (-),score=120.65 gnl/TRDRNA2_/TRDRNA2_169273_c1_seq2:151-2280(-)
MTVVTLSVWLQVPNDATEFLSSVSHGRRLEIADARVSIAIEKVRSSAQVAIGDDMDLQYPPKPLFGILMGLISQLTEKQNEKRSQELQSEEAANEASTNKQLEFIRLAAAAEALRSTAPSPNIRVAASLMLRPSLLRGIPGSFGTYLHYHLVAPEGPRFDHIIVFVDEDPSIRDGADPVSALWLWATEAEESKSLWGRVTFVDGSGEAAAASGAAESIRGGLIKAPELRAAALSGELLAKQALNSVRALSMAELLGMDWLLCNLDADEAFVICPEGEDANQFHPLRVSELLAAVPQDFWQVVFSNHEAVPPSAELRSSWKPGTDFFYQCTFFKRNPMLLQDVGSAEEQESCLNFWFTRAKAIFETLGKAGGKETGWARPVLPPQKPLAALFTAYVNGKSAVRVSQCRYLEAWPVGAHRWTAHVEKVSDDGIVQHAAIVAPQDACLLHYPYCEGPSGVARKYQARTMEQWNSIEFHMLCKRAYELGSEAVGKFYEALALSERDEEEVERQLAAGVCLRVTRASDACAKLLPLVSSTADEERWPVLGLSERIDMSETIFDWFDEDGDGFWSLDDYVRYKRAIHGIMASADWNELIVVIGATWPQGSAPTEADFLCGLSKQHMVRVASDAKEQVRIGFPNDLRRAYAAVFGRALPAPPEASPSNVKDPQASVEAGCLEVEANVRDPMVPTSLFDFEALDAVSIEDECSPVDR